MKTGIVITMAALLIVSCAMGVQAAKVVQNSTLLSIPDGSSLDWTVAGFNTSLGTLNSVTIDLTTKVKGPWQVEKNVKGGSPVQSSGTVQGETDASYYLNSSLNGTCSAIDTQTWSTTLVNKGDSVGGTLGANNSESFKYTKGSFNLTPFDNQWMVSFNNPSYIEMTNSPANVSSSSNIDGFGRAKVIYNYTPAPEPAGILVLMAGAGGMLGLIKRRRA